MEDDGKGPVEPGAHFYRSYQLDGDGNPINKRNAWQARSVLYVRLIPPGAADVVHFRVRDSEGRDGADYTSTREAELSQVFAATTRSSLRRHAEAGPEPALWDSIATGWITIQPRVFQPTFRPDSRPDSRSADRHAGARRLRRLPLGETALEPVVRKQDRERWNDWGIGLLLQGDLKGAEYAFDRVTEAEPGYADGWLNVARALIQEGETEAARPFVEKALALQPRTGARPFLPGA